METLLKIFSSERVMRPIIPFMLNARAVTNSAFIAPIFQCCTPQYYAEADEREDSDVCPICTTYCLALSVLGCYLEYARPFASDEERRHIVYPILGRRWHPRSVHLMFIRVFE